MTDTIDPLERIWRALAQAPWGPITALAQRADVSVEIARDCLAQLATAGLPIESDATGYVCAIAPVPLLPPQRSWFETSEIHFQLDSTQLRARELVRSGMGCALVCAEQQTAGRGRAGRNWSSPLGAHLYLTLAWPFRRALAQMSGLSLVIGLAVRRALATLGIAVQLKWPNDILLHGRKLGGILVELMDQPAGGCTALIGIGLNHRMPDAFAPEQPWIDLAACAASAPSRQQVLEQVPDALAPLLAQFECDGFAALTAEFDAAHVLQGKALQLPGEQERAVVCGVDALGQLGLMAGARPVHVQAGELSLLRPVLDVPWRLLIDCGNTRLKWAWSPLADPGVVLAGRAVALRDPAGAARPWPQVLADLDDAIAAQQIGTAPSEQVLASSSGGDRLAMQAQLQAHFQGPVRRLASPATLGRWRSAYTQAHTLGVDRALAMCALLPVLPAGSRALLVSAGTALTLDVLDADGRHHGGLIAAAPALQRDALAALSPHLRTGAPSPETGLASSSAAAVYNASRLMAVALIERVACDQAVDRVVISGGAVLELLPLLAVRVPVQCLPGLVLRGLAFAATAPDTP